MAIRAGGQRSNPRELVGLADDILAWFGRHPGFASAQKVLVELLGAAMAPLGPLVRVPEELLEVRNMLVTRIEKWMAQTTLEMRQELQQEMQQQLLEIQRQQLLEAEQRGEEKGEAALLLRQLERRFGALPDWARDRVRAAGTVAMEEWGLRVLDAGSLEEVLA